MLRGDLAAIEARGRLRTLIPAAGLDFSSNDYLGLAGSPRLARAAMAAIARGVPMGAGGSRLLRGHCEEHVRLEEEAAGLFGADSALFLGGGYGANALLFSTLPQRGDLVVYDALIHASVHAGMRAGRAETVAVAHNDVDAAADAIAAWRGRGGRGTAWIAIESLYSMDGDRAPLPDYAALADRSGAMLMIDEAHATGVFGPGGRGLAAGLDGRDNVVVLRTCGKALGCEGALVLAPAIVRDFIVNRGRGFIFSTAPSPLMAAVVRDALACLGDEPDRRARLHALIATTADALAAIGVAPSGSQIQPIVIGGEARTMAVAAAVQAAGFDVRGVRPPTVPDGTSRLRVSLTLNIDADDVAALTAVIAQAMENGR